MMKAQPECWRGAMQKCCGICRWFDGVNAHGYGYCHHRLEPHPGTYDDFDIDNLFDKRRPDEVCENWTPQDPPEA
jgi:hypothetical protein